MSTLFASTRAVLSILCVRRRSCFTDVVPIGAPVPPPLTVAAPPSTRGAADAVPAASSRAPHMVAICRLHPARRRPDTFVPCVILVSPSSLVRRLTGLEVGAQSKAHHPRRVVQVGVVFGEPVERAVA